MRIHPARIFVLLCLFWQALNAGTDIHPPANAADTLYMLPNPCDSAGVIYFSIAQDDTVSLNVHNMAGKVIRQYYQKTFLAAGNYSVSFRCDSFPPGIFIVMLETGFSKKTLKIVSPGTITDLNENTAFSGVVYPNPTDGVLHVDLPGPKRIIIRDGWGRVVYTRQTHETLVHLRDLSAGCFLLQVYGTGQDLLLRGKLLVQ